MTETKTPRRWRRITTTIGLTAVALVALPTLASAAGSVTVVDGDTLVVDGEKIRIQGIDTPEKGQPCYDEATEELRRLVASGDVQVVSRDGTDRYGRTIAKLRVGGKDVGLALIQSGVARARYDSRDGYGGHSNEFLYHALQRETACTTADGPVTYAGPIGDTTTYPDEVEPEQDEVTAPFWTWAALAALAAEGGVPFDGGVSFSAEFGDSHTAREAAATDLWFAVAAKHEAEAASAAAEAARVAAEQEAAAAAEREAARQQQEDQARQREAQREQQQQQSERSSGSSDRRSNDNPYDDGGARIPAGTPGYPRGGCPPGGCT